jgi:hypothetical protein
MVQKGRMNVAVTEACLRKIWPLTATEGKKKRKKEMIKGREEGRRIEGKEGERVGGRKGTGLVSSQQELRVSRISLFRANSGRCAHTYTTV